MPGAALEIQGGDSVGVGGGALRPVGRGSAQADVTLLPAASHT